MYVFVLSLFVLSLHFPLLIIFLSFQSHVCYVAASAAGLEEMASFRSLPRKCCSSPVSTFEIFSLTSTASSAVVSEDSKGSVD